MSDGIADTGPGSAKTSMLGRKTVPGPFRSSAATEGEDTKGCKNDTRLAAVELPGGLAVEEPPGRLPAVRGCTGLQASDGNNLVSGPHPKREETGAAAEDSKGAIIEWLERRDCAIAANSDEAGDELGW